MQFEIDPTDFFHLEMQPFSQANGPDLTLTGPAVIRRIDKHKEGVAVEFLKELKTFKPSL